MDQCTIQVSLAYYDQVKEKETLPAMDENVNRTPVTVIRTLVMCIEIAY